MVKNDYKKDVEKLIEETNLEVARKIKAIEKKYGKKTDITAYVDEKTYPNPEERKLIYKSIREQFPDAEIINTKVNWVYRVTWLVKGKEVILSDVKRRKVFE